MIPKFCYLEKIGRLARGKNEELRAAELERLRREPGLPPYDRLGVLKKMPFVAKKGFVLRSYGQTLSGPL